MSDKGGGMKRRNYQAPRPRITITKDIIEMAVRRDSGHCMIADAIKLAVPGARSISVDLASIRWTDPEKGVRYTYLTPRIGQLALLDFDQGREGIEPFSFQLRNGQITKAHVKKRSVRDISHELPTGPKLVDDPSDKRAGRVPVRVGGKPPPIGPLSNSAKVKVGKRREFGLRALSR